MLISDEVVQRTGRRLELMSPAEFQGEIRRLADAQPAVFAYALAATEDWHPDVSELALILCVRVVGMFEEALRPAKLEEVTQEQLDQQDRRNLEMLESLRLADPGTHARVAAIETGSQPYLMHFIAAALFETDEATPEGYPEMSDHEQGLVFLVLKTVVDALDATTTVPN